MCVYTFVCTVHGCLYVETGQTTKVVQCIWTDCRCLLVVQILEGAYICCVTTFGEGFFFFFDVTILEVFIELVTILLLFLVLVFGHEACGIFAPQPGIKPKPPALEGEVLTTGSSGKPSQYHF